MLTENEIMFLQEELKTAKNPLFYYDNDPDGLCAFLLLYKINREGRGIIVNSAPKVDMKLFHKVTENNPDKIFVLDLSEIEQEFIDNAKRPIIWIDHHQPMKLKNVHYYNPRIKDPEAYIPTTVMAYQVNQKPEDLWIATIGCLSDYCMPKYIDEFAKKYPHLMPKKKDLDTIIFNSPLGNLVRIFFFLLKGKTSEVKKCVTILSRINSPDEILNQETPAGKFLYQRFEKFNKKYEVLFKEATKKVGREKLLIFYYDQEKLSFTSDLANELSSKYPKKAILIYRRKSGEMKCSLRARFDIASVLAKALEGIDGYGGGHPNACGAVIKEEDWDQFLSNLNRRLKEKK